MKTSPLILASLLVAVIAAPTAAHAAPGWVNGPSTFHSGTCSVGPAQTEAFAGYWNDPTDPVTTGDITYIHVLARNLTCFDGVSIEMFLPPGASLAISPANPVFCRHEKATGELMPINCRQTPIVGPNNGFFFVYTGTTPEAAGLAPGQSLDIRVPVLLERELTGTTADSFGGRVHNMWALPPLPVKPMTVLYAPQFTSQSATNITATSATAAFSMTNFYAAGSTTIEYGTTPQLGSSTSPVNVGTGYGINGTQPLGGLTPNSIYYWRVRFNKTGGGSFYGPTQQFTTSSIGVTISLRGNGMGRVISNWPGIDCGEGHTQCTATIPYGATITLTPLSTLPTVFTGWGGACSGTGLCRLYVTSNMNVTATFDYGTGTPLPGDPPPTRR